MIKLVEKTIQILEQGKTVVWATVVSVKGSTPRQVGSRMMIAGPKQIEGSVGGGRLEADVISNAQALLQTPGTRLLTVQMTGNDVSQTEMICGGQVTLYLETLEQKEISFMQQLLESVSGRADVMMITDLNKQTRASNRYHLISPSSDSILDELLTEAQQEMVKSFSQKKSGAALFANDENGKQLFFEYVRTPDRLFIFGGGHVAYDLAWFADRCDFQVSVWDDRPEFANQERFPMAYNLFTAPLGEVIQDLELGSGDYIVIVTRAHLQDLEVLRHVVKQVPQYIGLIGSRRKRTMIYAQLEEEGIAKSKLEQVHSPIGLPIKAQTPAELAVSIIGEIVQVRAEVLETATVGQTGINK